MFAKLYSKLASLDSKLELRGSTRVCKTQIACDGSLIRKKIHVEIKDLKLEFPFFPFHKQVFSCSSSVLFFFLPNLSLLLPGSGPLFFFLPSSSSSSSSSSSFLIFSSVLCSSVPLFSISLFLPDLICFDLFHYRNRVL